MEEKKEKKISTKIVPFFVLLSGFDFMSKFGHLTQAEADDHLDENMEKWKEMCSKYNIKYIENQGAMSPFTYGKYNAKLSKRLLNDAPFCGSTNTCGVIAVFNALKGMGITEDYVEFPNLLNYFETRSVILNGYFGTSFKGLVKFFKDKGFDIKFFSGRKINKDNMDFLEENYTSFIFMSFNNKDNVYDMMHHMCITKEEKGFYIHNSYNKENNFPTLYDAVTRYNASNGKVSKPIAVCGIRKFG